MKLSKEDKARICTEEREAIREKSDAGIGGSLNNAASVVSSMLSMNRDSLTQANQRTNSSIKFPIQPYGFGTPDVQCVPISDMLDYYPPFRAGNVHADLDANLWIKTSPTRSSTGELLDVLNNRGELFERVQLPVGRTLVGFGKGGALFLKYKEDDGRWLLERTHLM